MDQEEIDKVVLAYLDKRGFKQAGLAFQQEKQQHSKGSNSSSTAQIDPDIAKQILAFSEVDGPAQYQEGYSKLRSWAYSSLDQYQKRSVDGGKQGTSLKKQKKEKVVSATAKASRPDSVTVSGAPRVKPELALPVIPIEVEQSILEDLRNRVQLSSMALPSISFYTFINTHNSCEGSLLASGSADCTVKLWDVTTSSKVPKTEENKSGSASRLRSLKTLPTKSTPVYALQLGHSQSSHKVILTSSRLLEPVKFLWDYADFLECTDLSVLLCLAFCLESLP
ncbi:UNVERIFIED_CONTAM: Transcription initiation factor TFIID subunit [Sesamum radiatum]|uniref:Transcription initiation factor TFIID subunit n=1 Tax=Sesamum radiatum TaxID=300843 RepID=A0AAW2VNM1_SESRA